MDGVNSVNNNDSSRPLTLRKLKKMDEASNVREIQTPKSYEEIPLGSHPNIRDARYCDISGLELTEEQLLNLCIDKTTIMSPK